MQFVFDLDRGEALNSNERLHYQAKAKKAAALRARGQAAGARETPATIPTPAHLIVTVIPATRRRTDPPNWWPTVKPLIDGLVDAGLLPDDSSEYIWRTSFQRGRHEDRAPDNKLRIVLDFTN